MKAFHCRCGQRIFFDNSHCTKCSVTLGFDPRRLDMIAIEQSGEHWVDDRGAAFRLCRNKTQLDICNWLVPADDVNEYCASCRLTAMIPNLNNPDNITRLAELESAKRHLLYSLMSFGLPLTGGDGFPYDLRFQFLEDQLSNPGVTDLEVKTGHLDGMITINVREADDAERESTRTAMLEHYRTLLGHFRHESGHYYFQRLLQRDPWLSRFTESFGNPATGYAEALERHYQQGQIANWQQRHVSAYAGAHPVEDWAETWAHYLHMTDTLETASTFHIGPRAIPPESPAAMIDRWVELSTAMNALNRSMGLPDPYPFVLTTEVRDKIAFVHDFITGSVPST